MAKGKYEYWLTPEGLLKLEGWARDGLTDEQIAQKDVYKRQIFDQLCKKGGFSKKAFLSWADKRGIIITQGGKTTKVKKFDGNPKRCVFLKLDDGTDKDGFIDIDDEQMELPFK